ncbi:class D sortase [Tumebacillus sp. BK434]|uniref:class D sortase n=1 Tax=Tumebacillus sp. BK434 TaxID=2512169 RepID=UPI0014048F37|nr:class D sortase [Tumebacillus sp. BK434]
MIWPAYDEWNQQRKQDELLTVWTQEQIQEKPSAANDAPTASAPQYKNIDGIPVMGAIVIEKIGLREPLLQGAGPEPLDLGIGVLETTSSLADTDHLVLAGHRSLKPGKHFNRLGELERGDKIVIESSKGTFSYGVERSFLVEPDDLSVLTASSNEAELTLITCHPMRNPTHRLIVKATLLKG